MIDLGGLRDYRTRLDRDRATYFADWPVDPSVREGAWQVLAGGVDELIALGPDAAEPEVLAALGRCVAAFDGLDDAVDKRSREDLCMNLYEVGSLCGIDAATEWVEDYRKW